MNCIHAVVSAAALGLASAAGAEIVVLSAERAVWSAAGEFGEPPPPHGWHAVVNGAGSYSYGSRSSWIYPDFYAYCVGEAYQNSWIGPDSIQATAGAATMAYGYFSPWAQGASVLDVVFTLTEDLPFYYFGTPDLFQLTGPGVDLYADSFSYEGLYTATGVLAASGTPYHLHSLLEYGGYFTMAVGVPAPGALVLAGLIALTPRRRRA